MSEVIIARLKKSIGSEAKVFLYNGFRYIGKITNCDDNYLEVLDYKTKSYKLIDIKEIKDANISILDGEDVD